MTLTYFGGHGVNVNMKFACKHDNSTNINRIGPKLIPWMYLKSVLVKFEEDDLDLFWRSRGSI